MNLSRHLSVKYMPGNNTDATICVPGFVPRSEQAFSMQLSVLLDLGDVWLVDYPDGAFNLDQVLNGLTELIKGINEEGIKPNIISVSFGCSLIFELLKREPDLPINKHILISPIVMLQDMFVSSSDTTFFGALAGSIIESRYCLNRGRGEIKKARKALRKLMAVGISYDSKSLCPEPLLTEVHEAILSVEDQGIHQRLEALARFKRLSGEPINNHPTLVIWAEDEKYVIRTASENYKLLSENTGRIFPRGISITLKSNDEKEIKHASLLFHAEYYNEHIRKFLEET